MRRSGGNFGYNHIAQSSGCFTFIVVIFLIIGWIQCVVKDIKSDWDINNLGKREVLYTVGIFMPPIGGVIGWFNIPEHPTKTVNNNEVSIK